MDIKQLTSQASTQLQNEKSKSTATTVTTDAASSRVVGQGTSQSTTSDTVTLSAQSIQIQQAIKSLETIPDIRQAKVDALAASINSGQYEVNSQNIAEKLTQSDSDLFTKA